MVKHICQIIGYFESNNNAYYMKRCILKNFSNDKYKFHLFIQSNMKYIYTKNYLENDNNVSYFNNNADLASLIKPMDYLILCVDLEHWFNCLYNFNPNNIYYITHGITNPSVNIDILKKIFCNWIKCKINLCIVCNQQYKITSQLKKNVFKLQSIPQFDLATLNQQERKNSILIVDAGDLNLSKSLEPIMNDYRNNIFKAIHLYFPNIKVFYKPWTNQSTLPSYPNKIYIPSHDLTYNYFFCDTIICFHFGTTFLEALLTDHKVILVSFDFLKNLSSEQSGCPQERLKCFITFDNKKYPNLLIAHDFPTFIKHINTVKTKPNYFETEDYLRDKNQYIKDSIGEYVPNIGKQLIDIIEKNELSNSQPINQKK